MWGEDGVQLSEDQIVQQLKKVIEQSSSPNGKGIGILTSDNRNNWAKAYQQLVKGIIVIRHLFIFLDFECIFDSYLIVSYQSRCLFITLNYLFSD